MQEITSLNLFNGISVSLAAQLKAGLKVKKYFSSEIKKVAIKCSKDNWGDLVTEIGDVTKVHFKDGVLYTENGNFNVGKIDLLTGGSPCQGFSFIGKRLNLEDERSKLFFEYLRLLKEIQPKFWLLENVRMNKESKDTLDRLLGVEGVLINSRLVSYQNRPRYYWTNIPFEIPKNKHISFQDFKEVRPNICRQYKVKRTPSREKMWNDGRGKGGRGVCKNITYAKKVNCLTRKQDRSPNSGLIEFEDFCRFLTREELEQAQTLPIGYTKCLTYNQAQDVLGDGWTCDVIVNFFKNIKDKEPIKVEKYEDGYIQGVLF